MKTKIKLTNGIVNKVNILTIPKIHPDDLGSIEGLYTEDDMNAFADWYMHNAVAYSDSNHALTSSMCIKDWLLSK